MRRLANTVFALAFLAALADGAVLLAPKLRHASARRLAEVFPAKRLFIELNGGARRLAGCRICNNRIVLTNGHVGYLKFRIPDTDWALRKELAFAEFLASNNVPFIHVQAPIGVDIPRSLLREPCECNGNEMAGWYCKQLQDKNVAVLDLREIFAGTAQLVSEYFFSSDHHWTYDAAFIAAEMVAAKIVKCLNLRISYDNDILKRSEWHVRRLPLWRSGSHAGRTGTLFAGVDDLDYREPAEKVKVRCVMYDREGMEHIREGDFSDVFVAKNVVNRRNWHVGSAYVVFPRVDIVGIFNNQSAPLPTKIVILGDSFARPIPAYLTKVFREVVLVDPRLFSSCKKFANVKLSEYVLSLNPDIVVQFMNPSSFNADFGDAGLGRSAVKMFNYGLE